MENNQLIMTILQALLNNNNNNSLAAAPAQAPEKKPSITEDFIGKMCVVRTYSAGVYVGIVRQIEGQEALMENARIVYRWEGAFTLLEMATNGITGGKISKPVAKIYLPQIINTIIMSEKAISSFNNIKPYEV
jgi:hypothetical protein